MNYAAKQEDFSKLENNECSEMLEFYESHVKEKEFRFLKKYKEGDGED
jgi:hypothetical protein